MPNRFDRLLERIADEYGELNERQQRMAIREFGRFRGEVSDLLADYSNDNDVVERRRINRLLRELNDVETHTRDYGDDAMNRVIDESAEFTTRRINVGAADVLGAALVAASLRPRVNRAAADYVKRRRPADGLVLSDRVWRLSGDMRDEISKVLRAGIIRGDSVSRMIRDVRAVHDNETWKIRRLVVTEGNTSYRRTVAENARQSDVVQALRLHPGVKMSEGCVSLAEEDRHGLGEGIFLPDDVDIYSPHPHCTSYITYVLADGSDGEEA